MTFSQCTENLTWFVRMTSELESRVVSVERINEYGNMATEVTNLSQLAVV